MKRSIYKYTNNSRNEEWQERSAKHPWHHTGCFYYRFTDYQQEAQGVPIVYRQQKTKQELMDGRVMGTHRTNSGVLIKNAANH